MEQTNLPRIDSAPVEYQPEFHDIFARWLTDLVDQLNASLQQLDDVIHVGISDNVNNQPSATTLPIPVTDMTVTSLVVARVIPVGAVTSVISVTPGVGSFTATLNAVPAVGASIIISYTAIVATL